MPLTACVNPREQSPDAITVHRWRLPLTFWPLQLSVWIVFSTVPITLWIFDLLKNEEALWIAALRPISGFLITSAVRPFYKKLAARRLSLPALPLLVIAINLPLAAIDYQGTLWFLRGIGILHAVTTVTHFLPGFFFIRWATLVAWTLLYFVAKQVIQNKSLTESKNTTEMEVLRAQIHPHFLFNALNSIIAEARNPEKVRSITQSLAEFLRFSLQQRQTLEPLETELAALQNYLLIQKVRFEEKLDYHIDAEPSAAHCLAPAFLILPLLENALKYGQQTSPLPLRVFISASVRKNQLKISVKNTGKWVEPNLATSLNTGIQNLKKRLFLLYEESAFLSIDQSEEGVIATISIPVTQLKS